MDMTPFQPLRFVPAGLLALVACSNSTGPLNGDVYVLESIAGVKLPAPYFAGPNDNYRVVADTIAIGSSRALNPAGKGERRTVYETVNPFERRGSNMAFDYIIANDKITITFPCPPNADCIAGPHLSGTIGDGSIVITQSVGTRQPLVFRRLFPLD
jgi:hypothetical protein